MNTCCSGVVVCLFIFNQQNENSFGTKAIWKRLDAQELSPRFGSTHVFCQTNNRVCPKKVPAQRFCSFAIALVIEHAVH